MVLLALGIDRLGASAIVSVPCTVSQGTGRDFANLTLIVYQFRLRARFVIKGPGGLIDLLQIVVSIVFTRFMALFQHTITCQSVLLPARNTEQSEKWRTVGVGQLLSDRFLQSLQRFYLYKKSSVSSAAWQKRCSFSKC